MSSIEIPPIVIGCWQLSDSHRPDPPKRDEVLDSLLTLAEAGFTAFDGADIYVGVEELLGDLHRRYLDRHGKEAARNLRFHTKYVPDASALQTLTPSQVERTIDRSLERLGVERLDLVQFHWWDYEIPGFVEAALTLDALRQRGKIRHLGSTNFDPPHLTPMIEAGVGFVTHQVQYSLLDPRPEKALVALCREKGHRILAYGTLAGGYLTERFLGRREPAPPSNRSQQKYRLIIEEFGGWDLFQDLLQTLHEIAQELEVSIPNVAGKWVLERNQVAALLVGATTSAHLESNRKTVELKLREEDRKRIGQILDRRRGPRGEVFELERLAGSPHRSLLKTNLNRKV